MNVPRLWEVPNFMIMVSQGSHVRELNEAMVRALIAVSEPRPTLCCDSCKSIVDPRYLYNLDRRLTGDDALHMFCRVCVGTAADNYGIPTNIKRWFPLLFTLEHALQMFTEKVLEPALDHNRQVEHEMRLREAHEKWLARRAQAAAGTILGIQPKAAGPLKRSARRAAEERRNGWKGLTRQTA
jgi:hypothetical protein